MRPDCRIPDPEQVLDCLDEGVLAMDGSCQVVAFNRAARQILEMREDPDHCRRCLEMVQRSLFHEGSPLRRSIERQEPVQACEMELVTRLGTHRSLRLQTRFFPGQAGGVVIFRDVTEERRLRHDLERRYGLEGIVGKSSAMQHVFDLIEQVADSDASVLIEGETGTGKELVARAIHQLGPRCRGPFVAVNCSSLSEGVLESELFGHVRGAFTGAERTKAGRFELASQGTIFLDEVAEVSPAIQVKLLRVLQERVIERVGDARQIPVDIRVISASNRPLRALVETGTLRPDLYYRLCVVPIQLPPLRRRRDDIPLLAQHFVDKVRSETGREISGMSTEALGLLLDYAWPGNVRELENFVEYAFVKARAGTIGPEHLPPELREGPGPLAPRRSSAPRSRERRRSDLTRERVAETLTLTGGNIARAARRLNVSRTTLYRRMEEHGLGRRPSP
jgi:transcriptional regulator with PAS, ATPase and Fis domain